MFEIRKYIWPAEGYETPFSGSFIGALDFIKNLVPAERENCHFIYAGDGAEGC